MRMKRSRNRCQRLEVPAGLEGGRAEVPAVRGMAVHLEHLEALEALEVRVARVVRSVALVALVAQEDLPEALVVLAALEERSEVLEVRAVRPVRAAHPEGQEVQREAQGALVVLHAALVDQGVRSEVQVAHPEVARVALLEVQVVPVAVNRRAQEGHGVVQEVDLARAAPPDQEGRSERDRRVEPIIRRCRLPAERNQNARDFSKKQIQ